MQLPAAQLRAEEMVGQPVSITLITRAASLLPNELGALLMSSYREAVLGWI